MQPPLQLRSLRTLVAWRGTVVGHKSSGRGRQAWCSFQVNSVKGSERSRPIVQPVKSSGAPVVGAHAKTPAEARDAEMPWNAESARKPMHLNAFGMQLNAFHAPGA